MIVSKLDDFAGTISRIDGGMREIKGRIPGARPVLVVRACSHTAASIWLRTLTHALHGIEIPAAYVTIEDQHMDPYLIDYSIGHEVAR